MMIGKRAEVKQTEFPNEITTVNKTIFPKRWLKSATGFISSCN